MKRVSIFFMCVCGVRALITWKLQKNEGEIEFNRNNKKKKNNKKLFSSTQMN